MKLVNTYISKDCTRKVLMYVDKNGHYEVKKYQLVDGGYWFASPLKERTYKHIESAHRAINKFIQ